MKRKIVISYDKVAKVYGAIVEVENLNAFKRDLASLVVAKQGTSNLERYPHDYDFIELGEYDNSTGEIKLLSNKAHLFNAGDFIIKDDSKKSGEDK